MISTMLFDVDGVLVVGDDVTSRASRLTLLRCSALLPLHVRSAWQQYTQAGAKNQVVAQK